MKYITDILEIIGCSCYIQVAICSLIYKNVFINFSTSMTFLAFTFQMCIIFCGCNWRNGINFFFLHVFRMGQQQRTYCHPFGVLLFQTQRQRRKDLDAWLNTAFLHHSWTESNRGIYPCWRTPMSVWPCWPSSLLQHLDVSHAHMQGTITNLSLNQCTF